MKVRRETRTTYCVAEIFFLMHDTRVIHYVRRNNGVHVRLTIYRFRDKIVTGSFDKTAKVWCSQTGHCLSTMWGHDAEVVVAKFSPTRCKLATGSIDATSKIFHIETGIENIAMLSHIINVRFDSDRLTRSIGQQHTALSNPLHDARAPSVQTIWESS